VGASVLLEAKDEEKFTRVLNSVIALVSMSGTEMDLPKETLVVLR